MTLRARSIIAISFWCLSGTCLMGCDFLFPPSDPGGNYQADPNESSEDCCSEYYSATVRGAIPSGSQYFWAALIRGDTVVKNGDSVFVTGDSISGIEIGVWVAYHDQIPPGEYELSIISCDSASQVGKLPMAGQATSVGVVQVPEYAWDDCRICYKTEIKYRTFIKCAIVPVIEFPSEFPITTCTIGFLSLNIFGAGDDRFFHYKNGTSRSEQLVNVYYDPANNDWEVSTTMSFGMTKTYGWKQIADIGGECPYELVDPQATPECAITASHGDPNGSILSVSYAEPQGSALTLSVDLEGFPPCPDDLRVPDFARCGIDGHIVLELDYFPELGMLYSLEGTHDGYPWHELYINGVSVYEYDPHVEGGDLLNLCPDWGDCDGEGEVNFPIRVLDEVP